jgi:2-dehydro-3-deoxygalactonokinase
MNGLEQTERACTPHGPGARPSADVPSVWIAMDGGTTNTRAWLMHGNRPVACATVSAGARDTARTGSPETLRAAVRQLLATVRRAPPRGQPALVAAAGMITSPLGLAAVPHVPAPARAEDLARGARRMNFADITDLPFWLFPGVRCGDLASDDVSDADLMRGEETLCVGLLAGERFKPPFTVLNLGSHWKWIQVDGAGRIARSRTSLTGELIHATQTATILAGALPGGPIARLDRAWCQRGMAGCRRSGLTRALFCVRLLEMRRRATPAQRLSFLLGAYVAAELEALERAKAFAGTRRVILAGSSAVAGAWQLALAQRRMAARGLRGRESEQAFLAGLGRLVQAVARGR